MKEDDYVAYYELKAMRLLDKMKAAPPAKKTVGKGAPKGGAKKAADKKVNKPRKADTDESDASILSDDSVKSPKVQERKMIPSVEESDSEVESPIKSVSPKKKKK